MRDELLKNCLDYFRSMPVFCRLLKGFCEKYRSYGSFMGSVSLSLRNDAEREMLEGFFGRSYRNQKSATISAKAFQKALTESRFAAISPEALLVGFHDAPLLGKREAEEQHREMLRCCWQRAIAAQEELAKSVASRSLLQSLRTMSSAEAAGGDRTELAALQQQMLNGHQEMSEEALLTSLTRQLAFLVRALELLDALRQQSHFQYLPVFAASLTGDPHALDAGSEKARLFGLLLEWLRAQAESPEEPMEAAALRRQSLYFSAGILLDDVSNYAMLCGVEASCAGGARHSGMAGFAAAGEPVNVPLSVIAKWQHLHCRDNTLWIVENPVVYAALAEQWKGQRSLMCMNGQPRLSAWLILRLLKKDGIMVRYAGDFDPEGLCIAERVQQSLDADRFSFWHMTEEDYALAISRKPIEARRLKMLEKVQHPLLRKTAAAIQKQGLAGYQENILTLYLMD